MSRDYVKITATMNMAAHYLLLEQIDNMKLRGWYFTQHDRKDFTKDHEEWVEIDYRLERSLKHSEEK